MKTVFWGLMLMLASILLGAQDPPEGGDVAAASDDVFRSSEQPGETPTGRRGRYKVKIDLPPGSFRVGCMCMDDSYSPAQSIGACSGHGGVRYWLYRTPEADTIRYPTDRHVAHSAPLSAAEMSAMARRKAFRQYPAPFDSGAQVTIGPAPFPWLPPDHPNDDFDLFDWSDVAGIGAGGGWAYAIMRLLLHYADKNEPLMRDALDYFLRRNRRPTAEPGGQDAEEARV